MIKALKIFWNEKQGAIVQITLGMITVLFLSIMVGVYLIARQANPILLDEKGNPRQSNSAR